MRAASSLSFSFRRMLTDANEPDEEVSSSGAPAGTLATLAGNAVAHIVRLAEEMRSGHRLRVADPPDASGKLRSAAPEETMTICPEPRCSRCGKPKWTV